MGDHFQAVLDQHDGNISQAAIALGIARNTLRSYIQKYGLRIGSSRPARPATPACSPPAPEVRIAEALHPSRLRPRWTPMAPPPTAWSTTPPAPRSGTRRTKALRWDRRLVAVMVIALRLASGHRAVLPGSAASSRC